MNKLDGRKRVEFPTNGHRVTFKGKPILETLASLDVEPDQVLRVAIGRLPRIRSQADQYLLAELVRLDGFLSQHLDAALVRGTATVIERNRYEVAGPATPGKSLSKVLDTAVQMRADATTLSTNDVLRAWLQYRDAEYADRPSGLDLIARAFGSRPIPGKSPQRQMRLNTKTHEFLDRLDRTINTPSDFQFVVAEEQGRLVFRLTSTLGDYWQLVDSVVTPRRAILTHFRDQFGGFTTDEIEELEELINRVETKETELQLFFERYPHFLRRWDYRDVFPQVYLQRKDDGPLVPDFLLTDSDYQRAAVIELKLPSPTIVRRQHNRDRFAGVVSEARTQLLRYRDWFRDKTNRARLSPHVGMEVYEPRLAVVIGRSSVFLDALDRQTLQADSPDIELVTYDDILTYAKRRRLVIHGG